MDKRIYAISTLVEKIAEAERNQEDYEKLKAAVSGDVKIPHWFTTEYYLQIEITHRLETTSSGWKPIKLPRSSLENHLTPSS